MTNYFKRGRRSDGTNITNFHLSYKASYLLVVNCKISLVQNDAAIFLNQKRFFCHGFETLWLFFLATNSKTFWATFETFEINLTQNPASYSRVASDSTTASATASTKTFLLRHRKNTTFFNAIYNNFWKKYLHVINKACGIER